MHEKHKFKPFMHRLNIPYMEPMGSLYKYNQTMQIFELLLMCVCVCVRALYTYIVFVHIYDVLVYLLLWSTPLGVDVDMTHQKRASDRTLMGPTLLGTVPASWGKPPLEIPMHYPHKYPFNKVQTQLCIISTYLYTGKLV